MGLLLALPSPWPVGPLFNCLMWEYCYPLVTGKMESLARCLWSSATCPRWILSVGVNEENWSGIILLIATAVELYDRCSELSLLLFQENQGIKLTTTASAMTATVTGTTIIVNNTPATPQLKTISLTSPLVSGGSTPTIIRQVQPKTIITTTAGGLPGVCCLWLYFL